MNVCGGFRPPLFDETGFTLIELLVVIVILGVLVGIAVPAYLSFEGGAQTATAKANVRSAIPAAEKMNFTNGSYSGITGATLRATAPGIGVNVKAVAINANSGYCIEDSEDGGTTIYDYVGGIPGAALQNGFAGGTIQPGACLQAVAIAAT
jgi:type IV pilus assembly protein PilA